MEKELASLGGVEWGKERVAGSVFMDPNAEPEEEAAAEEAPAEQVASAESTTDATAAAEGPDPSLVAAGESAFRQCASCHQIGEGAKNRSGPQLNGVFGRVVGSVEGFRYSNAIKDASSEGVVWDEETLSGFLADPKGYLNGTRMSFRGVKDEADLAAIIAYLASFQE
jgi:cytochrome c